MGRESLESRSQIGELPFDERDCLLEFSLKSCQETLLFLKAALKSVQAMFRMLTTVFQ
jgi:hypothetical protein